MNDNQKITRFPVSLDPKDNTLLIKLQAAVQIEKDKRVPIAEVIRLAIRRMSAAYNIS